MECKKTLLTLSGNELNTFMKEVNRYYFSLKSPSVVTLPNKPAKFKKKKYVHGM